MSGTGFAEGIGDISDGCVHCVPAWGNLHRFIHQAIARREFVSQWKGPKASSWLVRTEAASETVLAEVAIDHEPDGI